MICLALQNRHLSQLSQLLPRALALVVVCLLLSLEPTSVAAQTEQIKATMTVDLLDQIAVSSSVDGVIKTIDFRTGMTVAKGDRLIQLETGRLEKQLGIAEAEHRALTEKAGNDSRGRIAQARERSAQLNVDKLREITTRYQTPIPALEITRAESELAEATAEKVGAEKEISQFQFEAQAKKNEIKLLEFDLKQSTISCQYDGAIARIERRPGEYIQKGETIVELYRLDRLSGVVLIDRNQLPPANAENVEGELVISGPGEERSFKITIRRVFPRIDVDDKYRAFVELENKKTSDGKWQLLPGTVGEATFDLTGSTQQKVADLSR